MARIYCHHCRVFYYATVMTLPYCARCRCSVEEFEPHHVLRGRCCPGGCGADLVVTFEPVTGIAGTALCPLCHAAWDVPTLVRDGITYEPVVRLDMLPFPD